MAGQNLNALDRVAIAGCKNFARAPRPRFPLTYRITDSASACPLSHGEITLRAGRIEQASLDSYRMLQLAQVPKVAGVDRRDRGARDAIGSAVAKRHQSLLGRPIALP